MLDVMTARERGVTPLPLGPRLQGPPDVVTSVRPRD
jgi:hypothetical protein